VAIQPLPGQWDSLNALLSAHNAVEDMAAAEYQDATYRQQHNDHVNDVIGAFTRRYPKQYLFEGAQRAGVACVPVNTPADIVADPYLAERGFFREVEHPRLGRLRDAGSPFGFAGRNWACTPAPEAGQDDEAIGIEELGLVDAAAEVVMNGGDPAWLPLRGVRVLDFTWMIVLARHAAAGDVRRRRDQDRVLQLRVDRVRRRGCTRRPELTRMDPSTMSISARGRSCSTSVTRRDRRSPGASPLFPMSLRQFHRRPTGPLEPWLR
jgi:hypothetical protein